MGGFALLVTALLSVNNYPTERTWVLRKSLEESGLFDPVKLASMNEEDISGLLQRAKYDRGEFLTNLIASRLRSVAQYLVGIGIKEAAAVLGSGRPEEVKSLLAKAKGVGPFVIQKFLLLRQSH